MKKLLYKLSSYVYRRYVKHCRKHGIEPIAFDFPEVIAISQWDNSAIGAVESVTTHAKSDDKFKK